MQRCGALCLLAIGVVTTAGAAVRWADINRQPAAWYAGSAAHVIATHVLSYQAPSGGWPKNIDMTQPLSAEYLAAEGSAAQAATIDNHATTTQLNFLAKVVAATGDLTFRAAYEQGLDYLLAAQYPSGGWPQFYPRRAGYYSHITYNDNAMVNVLECLRAVAKYSGPNALVDARRQARVAAAVEQGIACLLRTQVRQAGKLTAWAAQHDTVTFAPAGARNFEPPALTANESVGIVRFLLAVQRPSPAIVAAIEGAVGWLESVKIAGYRLDDTPGADGRKDRHLVADPAAPPLWARFYELGTNQPIFVGRDKIVHYDYHEIERERRGGYDYLGDWPAKLLARDYPRWRAQQFRP